jgi:hypothetical protein
LNREGKPLPPGFSDRPKLSAGQRWLLHGAFWELSTDRQVGFGEGPIPWSSVARFADREGSCGIGFADFLHIIRALDRAYLQHRAEERDKAQNGRSGKP